MIGRERVSILVPSSSADSAGDLGLPDWRELTQTWADVRPLTGRERLQAATVAASVTYRVALRYRPDVTVAAKLVCLGPDFAASTMQIHAVIKDQRRGRMELDCSEVVA